VTINILAVLLCLPTGIFYTVWAGMLFFDGRALKGFGIAVAAFVLLALAAANLYILEAAS
jgi:hypothetical protein